MAINQIGPGKRHRTKRLCERTILALLVAMIGNLVTADMRAQSADEYQVKAAFIFNFAKFVDWPADILGSGSDLVVGVVGDDPFGGALDRLNGNLANGRRLRIKRLRAGDNLKACQILFISNSEGRNLKRIMDSIRGSSVLTIGELPQFNQSGGMIRFVVNNDKVRFEINASAAGEARLKISSKLLALSK